MEYIEIKEQIKQKLPVARDLGDSENLLELGLSSLTIMRLVNQWRKQGRCSFFLFSASSL